jgi:hypothetical protein
MVHLGAILILGATNHGPLHRTAEEGPLADVGPSYGYHAVDILQL